MRTLLVVPARNEARTLGAWAPLARSTTAGSVRVLVVDDHSTDGTRAVAEAAGLECIPSRFAPGKAGAVRTGLEEGASWGADVVGIADADVVLDEGAVEAAAARLADPSVGMVTGRQVFDRPDAYDRFTAWVRRIESMTGDVMSVHGQLLLWRADAGAVPTAGLAADDLDVRMQVRRRGLAVVQEQDAVFHEIKPTDPLTRRDQALRRARAFWPALVRHWPGRGLPMRARFQLAAYLVGPPLAPLAAAGWWILLAVLHPVVAATLLAVVLALPAGRQWLRIAALILASGFGGLLGRGTGDAWEPAR